MAFFDDIVAQPSGPYVPESVVRSSGFFEDILEPNPPYPVERISEEPAVVQPPDTEGGGMFGDIITGALRYGPALIATTGGPIGAVAAGVGEAGAQALEYAREGTPFRPGELAFETALGAIPLGKAARALERTKLLRNAPKVVRGTASGAAEGAAFATGAAGARHVVQEGELPELSDLALPAALGTGLGALAGRARSRGLVGKIVREGEEGQSVFRYEGAAEGDLPALRARDPESRYDLEVVDGAVIARPKARVEIEPELPLGLEKTGQPIRREGKLGPEARAERVAGDLQTPSLDEFARELAKFNPMAGETGVELQLTQQFLTRLGDEIISDPTNALRIRDTDAYKLGLRFNRTVFENARRTPSGIQEVDEMLNRAYTAIETKISSAGLANQSMSQIRRAFNQHLDEMMGNLKTHPSLARRLNDLRRSLLVTQLTTSVRNFVSNAGRLTLDGIEQAFNEALHGRPIGAAKVLGRRLRSLGEVGGKLGRLGRPLTRGQETTEAVIAEHPFLARELFGGTQTGGEAVAFGTDPFGQAISTVTDLAQWMNFRFNKNGEKLWRAQAFDVTLRDLLERNGYDISSAIRNPTNIPGGLVRQAVDRALELTFAAPAKGKAAKMIVNTINNTPISAVIPFPRFLVNGFKLLSQHNPAGMFRLLYGKNAAGQFLAADPEARIEALSQSAAGTMLLGGAFMLLNSEYATGQWDRLNVGKDDETGRDRILDIKPYAPFSGFMFLGHLANEMATNGNLDNVSQADWREGLLAINRLGGIGSAFTNLLAGYGDTGSFAASMREGIGEYISGFAVPLLTLKDAIPAAGRATPGLSDETRDVFAQEAFRRDVREEPLLGPIKQNIPFAARNLPARFDALTGEVRQSERGIPRQITGLNIVDQDIVERTLTDLNIQPFRKGPRLKSDRPEARILQRNTERRMGELVQAEVPRFIRSDYFQGLSREEQKAELNLLMNELRSAAEDEALDTLEGQVAGFEDIASFTETPSTYPDIDRRARAQEAIQDIFGGR